MVVTRKKNTARSGRVSGPTKSNQAPQTRIKGNSDIFEANIYKGVGEDLEKSLPNDSIDSRTEVTHVVATQNPQKPLDLGIECEMEDCQETSSSGKQ